MCVIIKLGDNMKKGLKDILGLSFVFLIIDQIVKIVLNNRMILNQTVIVIKNFFSITLVHNTGAAFSLFSGNRYLFIFIAILIILGLIFYIKGLEYLDELDVFIYSMLFAGILGNLVDRVVYGYVIDYLSFNFGNFLFPVFNFADICIVVAVFLYIARTIKGDLWK